MKGFPMQNTSALKRMKGKPEGKGGRAYDQPFAKYNSALKQTDDDLKDYLLDEKGFNQVEADKMIADGAYTLESQDFMKWYITKKGGDVPAPDVNSPTKMVEQSVYSKEAQNLLNAVPDQEAYDKLTELEQREFDVAAKKYGLPQKLVPKT